MGVDKRQVSRWKNNPASGNTSGKCKKSEVITAAQKLFDLSTDETEVLANKAGLSVKSESDFITNFNTILENYKGSYRALCQEAGVDERMFRHLRAGKFVRKETLLALSITAGATFHDVQKVLRAARYILSDSLPADVVVKWMLNNCAGGEGLIQQINDTLYMLGLPVLMTREYNKE